MTVIPNDIDTELTGISNSKSAIKQAIIDQGVEVSEEDALSTYAAKIRQINTGGSSRNIGEIVESVIPLTDAGLHLLDGAVIDGNGAYSDFVDYIAEIANMATTTNTISNFEVNPSNAFDNNSETEGMTGLSITIEGNAYIGQSGLTKPVKSLRIMQGANASSYCSSYKLQYSDDGTTWNDIQTVTGGTNVRWQSVLVNDYTPAGETHSFRLLANSFAGTQGSNQWRVFEVELFPTKFSGFVPESAWQNTVTTYGVCGKFVYNRTNNTVRLPKITGIVEGTTNVNALTSLVEAGLPNIVGAFSAGTALYPQYMSGSFYSISDETLQGASTGEISGNIGFDASRSNSIYGKSNTVQPQTVKVLYYMVIATSTKTEVEVDIDNIATDLNGKADADFTNVDDTARERMANASMPSSTYDNLTIGASGTQYIAPADGWVFADGVATGSPAYIRISNETNNGYPSDLEFSPGAGVGANANLPIAKGETFSFDYNNMTPRILKFYYAKGAENEA